MRFLETLIRRARARAYKKGKRPAPGTLLYSPSLDMQYAWRDAHPVLTTTWQPTNNCVLPHPHLGKCSET